MLWRLPYCNGYMIHSESLSATSKRGSERYQHNKIISVLQYKKDHDRVDVKKQLREQDSSVTTQLPLTRLCSAITHLYLLMMQISIMAPFYLLICATFCDGSSTVPLTSTQVSNLEIAMF